VIGLLVGGNGFLFYVNNTLSNEKKELGKKLNNVKVAKAELEIEYNKAVDELEAMKGENKELNTRIDVMITELATKKRTISRLISYKTKYRQKQVIIDGLKVAVDNYLAEIARLKEEFTMTTDSLTRHITKQEEYSQQLEVEKEQLTEKVALGSILSVQLINAYGLRDKNGKITTKAKKTDKIIMEFTLPENKLLDRGDLDIYVCIIGPGGATISIEDRGSGRFLPADGGDEMPFTMLETVHYTNTEEKVKIKWDKVTAGFASGNYKIELYQEGHQIGKSTLYLK